mgnify:CR=1 FL=1
MTVFHCFSGPSFAYNIAKQKRAIANISEFNSGILVDGNVITHGDTSSNASLAAGGEQVTWTQDLRHEFQIHTIRIYKTGSGKVKQLKILHFSIHQHIQM